MAPFWNSITANDQTGAILGDRARIAGVLGQAVGHQVYPESLHWVQGCLAALARRGPARFLVLAGPDAAPFYPEVARAFTDRPPDRALLGDDASRLVEVPCTAPAAAALRKALPWTAPQAIAGRPSVGLGDRLGLATPGHVRAVRGTGYVPVLAQQSIREMTRTGRSPQQVLDDATWGVFQAGFADGFAADADHLKNAEAIDRCAASGFTFYTVDPGDHVDDAADNADAAALAHAFDALPWDDLETTADDLRRAYLAKTVRLESGHTIELDEGALHRAAVKYGRAVAHTAALYRHLVGRLGRGRFEFEVSVDETQTPTSIAEHYVVAKELARLGVEWVSLAPRFVGRFEKGVDYIGDLGQLEGTFVDHLAVARALGDYKISLHSGSDKFSVYEMAARHGGRRVHVKTAGTSYLEALRVIAGCEPELFREILAFARERYETDKATYHVSADLAKVPAPDDLADDALPALLDAFDSRQVLHVTFGSVLTAEGGERFRTRLLAALTTHEEAYAEALEAHLGRHIAPFLQGL